MLQLRSQESSEIAGVKAGNSQRVSKVAIRSLASQTMVHPRGISPIYQSHPLPEKGRSNDFLPVLLREERYYTTSKVKPRRNTE